jgi:hypothetical protein
MREVTKPLFDKLIDQEINEIITQGAKEYSIILNEESTSEDLKNANKALNEARKSLDKKKWHAKKQKEMF